MKVIGFDTETDLITRGCNTPPLVCLTLAGGRDTADLVGAINNLPNTTAHATSNGWQALVGADCALEAYRICRQTGAVMVAHNMPYDVGVLANHEQNIRSAELNQSLVDATSDIEAGRLCDTLVAEKLLTIALDLTTFDTRTSPPQRASYSLARCAKVYLGVDLSEDKTKLETLHKNGVPRSEWPWRYRYIDLLDTPVHLWPESAKSYAAMDAHYAREVFLAQRSKDIAVDGHPVVDNGVVTNELEQTAAAFALHMAAAEGAPVDADAVSLYEQDINALLATYEEATKALGIVRINRCSNCGDNMGGTGYIGSFPNLKVCPICHAQDHATCLEQGVYKRRTALAGIGKLYTKRLVQIVRWGYKGDPPLTERPKNQSESAYAKWTPSVKTDEETLSVINHPMVQQFVEGKKATKARGTYLPPLLEALADTGRLVSRPNVLVRSGRTSWTGPNLQNPPRKGRFRECFVAPTGCVMASIDYSTLELATLAQVCLILFGESRMAALINDGTDLHAWFGARLLGVSYEDMMQRLGTGDPQAKAVRQVAKIPNFGLPGGLGPKGLVEYAAKFGVFLELDQEVTIDGAQVPSARDLCREWKKAFPEMRSYFAMISHESDLSASGRFSVKQLGSGRVRGGATYTAAANTYFQGLAADGAKAAMWALFKACYTDPSSPLFGCRVWNFIHDEFLLLGPEGTSHLWAPEASRIMVEQMRVYTPSVRQAAPPALMRAWHKDAEPIYNADGELLVWVPTDTLPGGLQSHTDRLTKVQRMLFAAGYDDALRAGADPEEALEEAQELVNTGVIG